MEILSICIVKFEVENFENLRSNTKVVKHCTEKECIYTANKHMLLFVQNKSSARWVGRWMDGWVGGWMEVIAGLRIAYRKSKMSELFNFDWPFLLFVFI